MVATRRSTRLSKPEAGGSHDPPAEEISMEGSASVRITRSRTKAHFPENNIPEYPKKEKASGKKSDMEETAEEQSTPKKTQDGDSKGSIAEMPADGDVSEVESNCSSVSGLHTLSFVRITRRRQILVPCQPESPVRNRQSKKASNEGNAHQENDDISEAESCSSVLSGRRTPSVSRITRSRQTKKRGLPVCEVQPEEFSDADSCCSGISNDQSVTVKRVTRSMHQRLQAETPLKREKKTNVVVVEDAELPETLITSEAIVISDSEQPSKGDFYAERACSPSSQINEQLSPCETIVHADLKQSSPRKKVRENNKMSPGKEELKDGNCESEDSAQVKAERKSERKGTGLECLSSNACKVMQSPSKVSDQDLEKPVMLTENLSPIKNLCTSLFAHESLDQTSIFSGKKTPNKTKNSRKPQPPGTKKDARQCPAHIKVDRVSELGGTKNIIPSSLTTDSSNDDCRDSVVSIDSDASPEEPVAESSSHAAKASGSEKCFTVSLLTSDESDEYESSDLEEMNETGTTVKASDSRTKTLDKSHGEELFVIDKTAGLDANKTYYMEEKEIMDDEQSEKSSDFEDDNEEFIDEDEDLFNASNNVLSLSSSIDPGVNLKKLGGLYIRFDAGKQKQGSHGVVPLKEKKKDELLKKSIITPGFEKKECIPPLRESAYQLKKQRREERAKTTGDGWFGMKAPEMTEELKNDLKVLKMRAAIDPKRFYKKNDREGLPKYFQVGTVVDSPVDFYHSRIPKKERKKNIVEELLADSEFRRYNKRKYQEIVAEKTALAAGKKNRKKKKFHK